MTKESIEVSVKRQRPWWRKRTSAATPQRDAQSGETRTGNDRDRVGELPSKLSVVVVDPSTGDGSVTIERGDARVGEEGSEEGTDESTDGVKGETINGVVNLEEDLDAGSVVGSDGGKDSNGESGGGSDESSGGGNSEMRQEWSDATLTNLLVLLVESLAYPTSPARIPEHMETAEYLPV